jgi:hypothetical protein
MAKVTFSFRSGINNKNEKFYMSVGVYPKTVEAEYLNETISAEPGVSIYLPANLQGPEAEALLDEYAKGDTIKREIARGLILTMPGERHSYDVELDDIHLTSRLTAKPNSNVAGGVAVYAALSTEGRVRVFEGLVSALAEYAASKTGINA